MLDVVPCFYHQMHQLPAFQFSIDRFLSYFLDVFRWFGTEKLIHHLFASRRCLLVSVLAKRTLRSVVVASSPIAFVIFFSFLIHVRDGVMPTARLLSEGATQSRNVTPAFSIFLLNNWLFDDGQLFCEKLLKVESIFLAANAKRFADSLIDLFENVFLGFDRAWHNLFLFF